MDRADKPAADILTPFAEHNVSDPERWLSVVAGSALAAYGLTRRSVGGLTLAALGGALVWRGATGHCPVYECLGVSTASELADQRQDSVPHGGGIRVEETVIIEETVTINEESLHEDLRPA